jgi:selenocysteine-specific elongation factor
MIHIAHTAHPPDSNTCRLAFFGNLLKGIEPVKEDLKRLKIYKLKTKEGQIDRVADEHTIIGKNLFKKESDISVFVGLYVTRSTTGARGRIEGAFGKSGKFKVYFTEGGQQDTQGTLILQFKRFIFGEKTDKIVQ